MKPFSLLILSILLISCSGSDGTTETFIQKNKVLLIRIDYTTTTLEGAKELIFGQNTTDFTIASDFQEPGDFGNIKLVYEQLDQLIFDGSIVWMGTGKMTYPNDFISSDNLSTISDPVAFPSESLFEKVLYSEFAIYPETMDYATIWNEVDDLQLVSEYRAENPESTINVFLYTPSVGVGNPLEWDYFLILKN